MMKYQFKNGTDFKPGAPLDVQAVWEFDKLPKSITARLVWVTEGKGTQDSQTAIEETWNPESNSGSRLLEWIAPRCPITHFGTLLRIQWQLELESNSPDVYAENLISIQVGCSPISRSSS